MAQREPIHAGTGEPVLLLHPFLCSQNVWNTVADDLAATGRFEVYAPTMLGHHGGRPSIVETVIHCVKNGCSGWRLFPIIFNYT